MEGIMDAVKENAAPSRVGVEAANRELAKRYRTQAIVLTMQKRFAESEAFARMALELHPDDIDILNDLGIAVWRRGGTLRPRKSTGSRVKSSPTTSGCLTTWDWLSTTRAGSTRPAIVIAGIELKPDTFDALMNLGIVLSDKGQFVEATQWLEAAPRAAARIGRYPAEPRYEPRPPGKVA